MEDDLPTLPSRSWPATVALVSLVLAALLTASVATGVGPVRWDPAVTAAAVDLRTTTLTTMFQKVTFAGSATVLVPLSVAMVGALALGRQWLRALVFATTVVGSELLTETLKLVVARDRPPAADRIGQAAQTFSFPSGHTLNSAVFLGLLVWTLWPAATRAVRAGALVGAVVLTVAVAASRVYLGYHWLTDVLASGLIATAILVTAAQLAARIARRRAPMKNEPSATARAGSTP